MGVSSKINKAVFFDRDGVINESVVIDGKPYPPSSIKYLNIIHGVKEGIQKLRKDGFKIFIVTNQPDVGRGKTSLDAIETINSFLKEELEIDEIFCCYHGSDDECNCRKPKPGMLLRAIKEWQIDENCSYMVGDRWRDIEAGNNASVKSIFIDYQYDEKRPENFLFSCSNTRDAINFILKQKNNFIL